MSKHGYILKMNDEALTKNQRQEKLGFFRAVLRWCQEKSFIQNCADWIPYGEKRIRDLEALSSHGPEIVVASVIKPSKTKPCAVSLV